ncbi:MAG: cupin domain-containing protein [Bacteroidetes bacterium]|nr:cupin domain-containing protein [Bacteroidota bacterium]MCL6098118.1 cupin domain-containing protein [Bacteroidota bacterium]
MKKYITLVLMIASAIVSVFAFTFIQSHKLEPKIILPNDIKWKPDAKSPGELQTIVLAGDPDKNELYTSRIKIPANMKLQPHFHLESRTVVVLLGTLYYAYGKNFVESKLTAMPPGTFFTEPSKQPHFAWAKDGDVVVQVTGVGPTGTKLLTQDH